MNYRIMFFINALVAVAFGVGFLIFPSMVLNQFDVDDYASTRMVAQFFGTAMLALGLLLWFAKDVTEAGMQKGMSIALLVGAGGGLIVTFLGMTSRVMRSNGWLVLVIYLLFGLGYAYLVFLKHEAFPVSAEQISEKHP
jgi:hypothetical protein